MRISDWSSDVCSSDLEALAGAGLDGYANRDPTTLSGGQRARVSLLRVLVSRPRALLLDEPFSKLDTPLKKRFREVLLEQAREEELPCLLRSEEHTSELQSLMRISYAVFCLKKKKQTNHNKFN